MKIRCKQSFVTILLIVLLLLSASVTEAQQESRGNKRQGQTGIPDAEQIEQMVKDLSNVLSLYEVQEKQISEVYTKHFEEVKELTDNGKSKPDSEVIKEMKSDLEMEVKLYLTKEQQEQFDAYLKKQQPTNRPQGKPGKGQGRPRR